MSLKRNNKNNNSECEAKCIPVESFNDTIKRIGSLLEEHKEYLNMFCFLVGTTLSVFLLIFFIIVLCLAHLHNFVKQMCIWHMGKKKEFLGK